jgi:hypothetical protein
MGLFLAKVRWTSPDLEKLMVVQTRDNMVPGPDPSNELEEALFDLE